jgi:hypothetical protein
VGVQKYLRAAAYPTPCPLAQREKSMTDHIYNVLFVFTGDSASISWRLRCLREIGELEGASHGHKTDA